MTLVVTVTNMRSFWSDPYLWIHLAGLAALPLFLELCFLGLAVGDPVLPVFLEVLFVAGIGIAPILWMQWQRPFCIFSLVALAIKPEFLTEQQRRILRLFKGTEGQVLAGISAIALLLVLWQIYRFAPLGTEAAALFPQTRLFGLGLAAIAFLFCNLFLQVPLSVARVMLASDTKLASLIPYPVEQIANDFTLLGLRVKQIVPPLLAEEPKPIKPVPPRAQRVPRSPVSGASVLAEPDARSELSPWDDLDGSDRPDSPVEQNDTIKPGNVSESSVEENVTAPLTGISELDVSEMGSDILPEQPGEDVSMASSASESESESSGLTVAESNHSEAETRETSGISSETGFNSSSDPSDAAHNPISDSGDRPDLT